MSDTLAATYAHAELELLFLCRIDTLDHVINELLRTNNPPFLCACPGAVALGTETYLGHKRERYVQKRHLPHV